jgi:hypothetical protein
MKTEGRLQMEVKRAITWVSNMWFEIFDTLSVSLQAVKQRKHRRLQYAIPGDVCVSLFMHYDFPQDAPPPHYITWDPVKTI